MVGRINGFGSTGPYRDRPAYDFIAQAMSGFMGINGRDGGEPMRAAPAGPMEYNMRRAMAISGRDWSILWSSGISIGIYVFATALLLAGLLFTLRGNHARQTEPA